MEKLPHQVSLFPGSFFRVDAYPPKKSQRKEIKSYYLVMLFNDKINLVTKDCFSNITSYN